MKSSPSTKAKNLALDDDHIEADASMYQDGTTQASPDLLTRIVAAAQALKDHKRKQLEFEDKAQEEKNAAFLLETDVLPSMMDEAAIPELTLDTLERVIREDEVYASISKDNMQKAIRWLDQHGYGSIVKSQLIIPLDRSNPERVETIKKLLISKRIDFEAAGSVHAQTLKAFAKESVQEERQLCAEISVHVQAIVKIKSAKKAPKSKSLSSI